MSATATEPKTKRPSAICETRYTASGLEITLPKQSSVALVRCRDVCNGLAAAAPVISAKARGIARALDGLIAELSNGPIQIPVEDDGEAASQQ